MRGRIHNYRITPAERKAIDHGVLLAVSDCGHRASMKKVPLRHKCEFCGDDVVTVGALMRSGDVVPIDLIHDIRQQAWREREAKRKAMPKHHRDYRAELVADRCDPTLVERLVTEYRWNGLVKRAGIDRAQNVVGLLTATRVDDRRYRPAHIDSLTTGAARATGVTALVIKSGKTITDWQYREKTA